MAIALIDTNQEKLLQKLSEPQTSGIFFKADLNQLLINANDLNEAPSTTGS